MKLSSLSWCAALTALPLAAHADLALQQQIADSIGYAADRWDYTASNRLSDQETFVNYTNTSGVWRTQNDSTWTSGFVPGIFWYLSDLSNDAIWANRGARWDQGVRSRATATDNDTGFQIYCAFGTALMLGADVDTSDYTSVIIQGADTLIDERWNSNIGAFRAWPASDSTPNTEPFEVNIDMMMNMEIILWASQHGGNTAWADAAISHADASWEDLVRDDYSTFHVVDYNLDGSVDSKRTHQGWKTDSTWSRGQAWAVYGYTMLYRYTQLPRMLERAEHTFDYFMTATEAQVDDYVPYSDFDAPIDSENPRDTSAAAIVASAALELYQTTGEQKYLTAAENMLNSLTQAPYLSIGTDYESVLAKGSEKWGEPEVGAVTGDYYFIEAMWRYLNWIPQDSIDTWRGYNVGGNFWAMTGDFLGPLYILQDPWVYSADMQHWIYLPEDASDANGGWGFVPKP
ncbi:MAG: putative unsaturated glucuronyl hydrolase [Puniceicoccaceae bacterium 5H]|nr:MAG: putative unsaturated glucuronyl hydrolase [Puniceicoccaceae bacterium 5H]